ncbi:MAG: hypothetical protein K0S28_1854 [Paucimonas sp.]|nr:hypothetical protein [Paucimonas sp.]
MDMDSANPAAGSEGTSAPDPVDLISGMLDREDNPAPQKPRDQSGKFASQNPNPSPEPEEIPEPGPGTPPDEGEDEDGDAPEQPEQPEAEPETYTVKIDGKEVAVTRDELLAGYQRQADYSRKTAEVAEARRAAEAEYQRVAAERQHYATQLDQVAAVLQATLPPRPPIEMRDADPIGYQNAKEDWEIRVGQLRDVLSERDRAQQQQQQHMQAMQQQTLQQARAQLVEMLPEWKRPEVAKAEQPKIAEHLRAIGYADHEIAAAADPRAVLMARESMLYRQLMASRPTVQNRLATAPRMVRPGAAGPAPDQKKAVISNVKRSGGKDMDAIARLIELG